MRGGVIESRHRLHIAVVDAAGRTHAHSGDVGTVTFARSAIKPLQALPLVDDGVATRFGFTDPHIAVACASHSGEEQHVTAVREMLRAIDAHEDDLACGPHEPFAEDAARALQHTGTAPGRVHNNCSGKHAGMLALARHHDWVAADYHLPEHPVQQRMLRELARWADVDERGIAVAVDGCGVATFAVPVAALAAGFARLAAAAAHGDAAPARIVTAMTTHPHMVGGTGRLCTDVTRVAGGRVFLKVGAEGVYCAGVPGAELGIAIKVEDGAKRAAEPAIVHVLSALGVLTADELAALDAHARPQIRNTRGTVVGEVRTSIQLEKHGG